MDIDIITWTTARLLTSGLLPPIPAAQPFVPPTPIVNPPVSTPNAPPLWADPSAPPTVNTPGHQLPPQLPQPWPRILPNARNPVTGAPIWDPELPPNGIPPAGMPQGTGPGLQTGLPIQPRIPQQPFWNPNIR
jgi:hypothetical protein